MPVIHLEYLLPDKMKAMPKDWKALKGKYAELIKTKKISFDKKLGLMLEKRPKLHKSIGSYKAGNPTLLVSANLKAMKTNATLLQTAATSYRTKIKVLGNPAQAEMDAFLAKVVSAAKNDVVWADGKITIMKTPKKK